MKKVIIAGGIIGLFMFSACSKDDSNLNNTTTTMINATDSNFIMMTSLGNNEEIMEGNLVASKATNAGVKWYGQFMIQEHTQAQADLQSLATSLNIKLPPTDSMTADAQSKLTMLNSLSGRAFDSTYIYNAVTDHQTVINLFQSELSGGMNASVKSYDNKYLPHIQLHMHLADSISHTL